MSSPSRSTIAFAVACLFATCFFAPTTQTLAQTTRPGVLVVVADPDNLPFSNAREEGFENQLAHLVARDLDLKLEYHWRATRRGYWRESVKANQADLVIGIPRNLDMALTTDPYYRSSYVFVTRETTSIASFDEPALKTLRIGIPLTGESNPPPSLALARRGMVANVAGFPVYGRHDPASRLIDAVADEHIDVAVAWGPPAGYFASRHSGLRVIPVTPLVDESLPMAFDVSMGVAKKNVLLRDRLNAVLRVRRAEIARILDEYHVPRAPMTTPPSERSDSDKEVATPDEVPGCCD
jgi:mxaJ protein